MQTKPSIPLRLWAVLAFVLVAIGAEAQMLHTPFPSNFRNVQSNELTNPSALAPVFQKWQRGQTVKVMQIGDSHVRGNYLPHALESALRSAFPRVDFAYFGINGAWARRFCEDDMIRRVVAERPDLVVVSFGTNEAHGATLDERAHAATLATLTQRIAAGCPGVCFLFTTPPGSYITQRTGSYTTGRGRRRRTRYTTTKAPNANTANVARSIVNFCQANRMAAWDLYTIAGGPSSACSNWRGAGLMAADQVHFLAQGYTLQGKLLGEAIQKAYTGAPVAGRQTRMMHGSTPREQQPYKTIKGF